MMRTSKNRFLKNDCLRSLCLWSLTCCLAGVSLHGVAQTNDDEKFDSSGFIVIRPEDDWTRHCHIGALVGMNIGGGFHENGLFNISGNNVANGIYDDGYVREDQTGNAGGYTSYWGYDNASQYNAAAQTLTFHSTSSYSTSGGANANGGPFVGFDLAYGDDYVYWKDAHCRIGWELGFDLLPISISDNHPMSATVNQSAYNFNTGSIILPGAPYHGGSSGQGPLLPSSPASVTSQTLLAGTVTGTRSLEVMLYTIRLGPSFSWGVTENLGFSLSAGSVIGMASGDYKYDEIIATGNSSATDVGSFGGADIVYGGYVNATLKYHVVDNGRDAYFYIGAQYTPMTDAIFSNGGRSGQLNLDGQVYFTVGIGWPF
jgi:hypothetical protein